MTTLEAPKDNLFRGLQGVPIELRADSDTAGTTMFGHFTKFDVWNEIDSYFEGRFMERTVPNSFKKTINENLSRVKVQFNHGYDVYVGASVLGPIDVLREDSEGPYYEVPLLDTDYNRERVLPQLQGRLMDGTMTGSVLGSSYRFRVTKEDWHEPAKASAFNPEKLPERTIREVSLYEFGPVVFPAQLEATAGVRSVSLTDHFFELKLQRTGQASRALQSFSQIAAAVGTAPTTTAEPLSALDGPKPGMSPALARARAFQALSA